MKLKNIITSGLIFFSYIANAQLIVDTTTYSQAQLISQVLIGNGVLVSNIVINCPSKAMGYFNGRNTNIGINGGIIMATGDASIAIGPNYSSSATASNPLRTYSDPQLKAIEPAAVYDPCIVEFDFIPDSNIIEFNYVFGSEEYHEYVGSIYNDAFGFFLSGPGISNPNYNIALLPGTSIPVTVNNINNGFSVNCSSSGPCKNCQYFYDNCNGNSVQFDGFTKVLVARADVLAGQKYHIKLAIADAGDGRLDSGVFLECGSFHSGGSTYRTQSACSGPLDGTIEELAKYLIIYPNPVTDLLRVSSPLSISSYRIIDMMGQKALESESLNAESFSINTANLPSGTYLLLLSSQSGTIHKMFIKQNDTQLR